MVAEAMNLDMRKAILFGLQMLDTASIEAIQANTLPTYLSHACAACGRK